MYKQISFNYIAIVLFTFFLSLQTAFSQDLKSGIVQYKIEYSGKAVDSSLVAFLPTRMIMTFNKRYVKEEILGTKNPNVIVKDFKERISYFLVVISDSQKFAITSRFEDAPIAIKDSAMIIRTNKTKDISGFLAYQVTCIQKQDTSDIFYIPLKNCEWAKNYLFNGVNGIVSDYMFMNNEMNIRFSIISIERKKLNFETFRIPDEYKMIEKTAFEKLRNATQIE